MSSNATVVGLRKIDTRHSAWILLGGTAAVALFVGMFVLVAGFQPTLAFIFLFWVGVLCTIFLSVEKQLLLLWVMLPFVDTFKRMVWLDADAGTMEMYLVLIAQDIIVAGILLKIALAFLKSDLKVRFRAVDGAVALFGLYSLSSALLTPGVPLIGRLATAGLWVWPISAYFLAARYLSGPRQVNQVTKLMVALAFIVALYGIHQFFGGFFPYETAWFERATNSANIAHLQYDASVGVFRTFGTMDSHSSYGIFLGIGLILAWAWRQRLGLPLWLGLSLIIAFGLALSFTRFTWAMPIFAAGFIFLFSYRKIRPLFDLKNWRRASWLLLGIVGAFFAFYLMMVGLYGRQLVPVSSPYLYRALGTGTLEARLQVNSVSIGRLKSAGLTGRGLAGSGFFARKFGFESKDVDYHNIFVDMLDSMGVLGLSIFLGLLYLLFKQSIKTIESQTRWQTRRVLVALFGLVLAMLTVGHFNGAVFYFGRALPYYFWAICGILAHYHESEM